MEQISSAISAKPRYQPDFLAGHERNRILPSGLMGKGRASIPLEDLEVHEMEVDWMQDAMWLAKCMV